MRLEPITTAFASQYFTTEPLGVANAAQNLIVNNVKLQKSHSYGDTVNQLYYIDIYISK